MFQEQGGHRPTSPLHELEVGANRAPYLLVINISKFSSQIYYARSPDCFVKELESDGDRSKQKCLFHFLQLETSELLMAVGFDCFKYCSIVVENCVLLANTPDTTIVKFKFKYTVKYNFYIKRKYI